ncbi:unnamed protein product [Phytophthora lilii]|uniref:Unnamed protein product n=1 Tax=Phytophthora lilii TaxID=2077276 RepID=A0A9W6TJJ0_9STRA|nr:unnamed protein product [Phytophthora lilii]
MAVLPTQVKPACDQGKLRANLSAYMNVSAQLRSKRDELYHADRRGTLKDRGLEMSFQVQKLKSASDKLRLTVCEQLRVLVEEIRRRLDATSAPGDQVSEEDETRRHVSQELAEKCVDLLHSITFTAMKEEIYEKERLLRNVKMHDGRSSVYVLLCIRYRVRPRSW